MPSLFIITGSNGAGKSTVGADYLLPDIKDTQYIFDGDKLALQKRTELRATLKAFKEAKNIADEWVDSLFEQKVKEAIKQIRTLPTKDISAIRLPYKLLKNLKEKNTGSL